MDKKFTHYIELAARFHVFALLNMYGIGKIIGGQFYRKGKLPAEVASQTLGNVEDFALAWTFMGNSYAYILFIGISQIIGAWMLMFERTKFLGIAILIPILVNIIIFDIIYLSEKGALASAIIYFLLLLLVLFLNKEKTKKIISSILDTSPRVSDGIKNKVKNAVIILVLFGAAFGIEQMIVTFIGH